MQEKCLVMVPSPFCAVIVDEELSWGHVRQTILLQGRVPGDCYCRFRTRLLVNTDLSDPWHA